MEQNKVEQPKIEEQKKRLAFDEKVAQNPGLKAILAWELRHNDARGGYGH